MAGTDGAEGSATDIIDDRLLGALHVRALTRAGLAHDPTVEHTAFQAGTLDALMAGSYDGDLTVGELLSHGDLGIGTVAALDGELVVVDGAAFVVDGDARVHRVPDERTTPFAVVCRFAPIAQEVLDGPLPLAGLHDCIERLAPTGAEVLAVRVDGVFSQLRLRSVARQQRPYPPLAEVTAHQREWEVPHVEGSLVGFRFPDASAGPEVPGFHLHFLAADRRTGGHVLDLVLGSGRLWVDVADELHVELAPDVGLGRPGAADRAAIAQVEGSRRR
jgi:acetolactate decarboxylase